MFHVTFIGGVGQSHFSDSTDLTVDFMQYTMLAVTLGITHCVSGSYIAICDCSALSCESCTNLNIFYPAAFKTKDRAPQLLGFTIYFSKDSSGS